MELFFFVDETKTIKINMLIEVKLGFIEWTNLEKIECKKPCHRRIVLVVFHSLVGVPTQMFLVRRL